jgi:2-keto-4-pentenoate hydratase/2-oxohepta-3-ene-1,7-dioic acid hydratase in catechol pathway
MKIGSYIHDGRASYGVLTNDGIVDLVPRLGGHYPDLLAMLRANALAEAEAATAGQPADFAADAVTYTPLIPAPVNVYCAGINYMDHIEETGREKPEHPTLFLKTLQSFAGHDQPIVRPHHSEQFDFEAEFAAVLSKPGRDIPQSDWRDYVAGYTCLMDGSIRDFQGRSADQGKNFYHSSAVGPWLTTLDEAPAEADMRIQGRLNGEIMQESSIDKLCYSVAELVAYYSQIFRFEAGDIISTGTPGGVGMSREPQLWLKPGDVFETEISGIGLLRNPVIAG